MSQRGPRDQLTILDAMLLIAGIAFGLCLFQEKLKFAKLFTSPDHDEWMMFAVSILGGLSLAGAPIIVLDRARRGHRWRSGALNWLAMGLASWSLAPVFILARLKV